VSERPTKGALPSDWSRVTQAAGTLPFDEKLPGPPPKWSAPAADAPLSGVWERLGDQIKITCSTAFCDDGLHCFRLNRWLARKLGPGSCRACGKALISMDRVAQRDLGDIDHTFSALQWEAVRHYFWHMPFGQRALNQATRLGRLALESGIEGHLRRRIGPAEPPFDGRQTPISERKANAYHYAQHAVAACCRTCVKNWHGIPVGRPLEGAEITYLADLMRRYLRARLPNLDDEPRKATGRSKPNNVHHLPPRQVESSADGGPQAHPHAS
jgi:hypothetical protein